MENQQFKSSLTSNGGFAFLLMMCVYFAVTLVAKLILQIFMVTDGVIYYAVSGLISSISICIVLWLTSANSKRNVISITNFKPFNPTFILYAIVLAIAMFFGFGFINNALAKVFASCGLNVGGIDLKITTTTEFIVYSVVFAFLPAVLEECFFRGLMLDRLEGKAFPVAITVSLCFAVYHGSFAQFVYQFIYGVSLTYLSIKAKSVIPSAIAHFINNFAIILFTYLGVNIALDNAMVIVMGICLFIVFWVSLLLYQTKKWSVNHQAGQQNTSIKGFWLPFGVCATCVYALLMILTLFL